MKIGLSVRTVHEAKKVFKKVKSEVRRKRYISRMHAGGILEGGEIKLGTLVDPHDAI
jgi:hypothetical protein